MNYVKDYKGTDFEGIYTVTIKNLDGSTDTRKHYDPNFYELFRMVEKCEIKWFKVELSNK